MPVWNNTFFMGETEFIKLLIISALAGGFLGIERQMVKVIAGTRTFMLTSIIGFLAVYISREIGYGFLNIVSAGVFLLTLLLGVIKNFKIEDLGMTTLLAYILAYVVGLLIGMGRVMEGVALSIISTAILTSKRYSIELSKTMTFDEMRNALEFGFIAFVLYPLLPDRVIDPLGVINPRNLMLIVIVVTMIGFLGFISLRKYGAKLGMVLTGALGGMVNSQATVSALSSKAKLNSSISSFAIQGMLMANCIMLLRNLFIAGTMSLKVAINMLPVVMAMVVVALALVYFTGIKKEKEKVDIPVESPFAIKPAVKFAIFFAGVSLLVKLSKNLGTTGVYLASFIAGFVSSGATVAGVASLSASGSLPPEVASTAAVFSILASLLTKIAIARFSGTAELSRKFTRYILLISLTGVVALSVYLVFS